MHLDFVLCILKEKKTLDAPPPHSDTVPIKTKQNGVAKLNDLLPS